MTAEGVQDVKAPDPELFKRYIDMFFAEVEPPNDEDKNTMLHMQYPPVYIIFFNIY